jgi:hypothetical protein
MPEVADQLFGFVDAGSHLQSTGTGLFSTATFFLIYAQKYLGSGAGRGG